MPLNLANNSDIDVLKWWIAKNGIVDSYTVHLIFALILIGACGVLIGIAAKNGWAGIAGCLMAIVIMLYLSFIPLAIGVFLAVIFSLLLAGKLFGMV